MQLRQPAARPVESTPPPADSLLLRFGTPGMGNGVPIVGNIRQEVWHGVHRWRLGVQILTYLSPNGENNILDGSAYRNKSKLEVLFGPDFFDQIRGKTVIDFGCGVGDELFEMASRGAAHVTGLDIRQKFNR